MSEMALIPLDDYKDICDAVREKTGSTETIKSGDMASLISEISGGGDDGQLDALIEGSITEVRSNASKIKDYKFYYCTSLTSANFPVATSGGEHTFENCSKLTSANIPLVKSIGINMFKGCSVLTSANFPVATSIGSVSFSGCSKLTSVDFPVAISIGASAFYGCSKLTSVDFSVATSIGNAAFQNCTSLTSANFPVATSIGSDAFRSCSQLTSLIIRTTSKVCTYSTTSAANDPSNANLKIYVPRALVDSYKAATNWVRLASKFVALEDYTVDGTTTGELDPTKVGA